MAVEIPVTRASEPVIGVDSTMSSALPAGDAVENIGQHHVGQPEIQNALRRRRTHKSTANNRHFLPHVHSPDWIEFVLLYCCRCMLA